MELSAGEWQSRGPPQGERLQAWTGAFALLTRDDDVT
jgi:hypothetical protein